MKLLDRYLAVRFLGALVRTLTVFTALYILVDLLSTRLQQIQKYDVSWRIVIEYYVFLVPYVVSQYVAPLAVLTAGLFVFGETAQNNEVTAALAGGISLRRFVRIPLFMGFLFSMVLFSVQEGFGPSAYRHARDLDRKFFGSDSMSKRGPVTWANLATGWTCHILKFNRLALTGEGVVMYARQNERQYLIEARSIFWDPDKRAWFLQRGTEYEFEPATQTRRSKRISRAPAPITESPERLFAYEQSPETKTLTEMRRDLAEARTRDMYVAPLEVKFHQRFSQPILSFVMIFLAVPFGMRLKRGGFAVSFGAAIGLAVVYLLLFFLASGLGQMGRLPAVVSAWLASWVFFVASVWLLVKTPT